MSTVKEVIVKNKRSGNGLVLLPKVMVKGVLYEGKQLYAGTNSVPLPQWEVVRTYPIVKKAISKGELVELNVEATQPTPKDVKEFLTFEKFCEEIVVGKDGITPEVGGHFVVTLKNEKSYRVKCSSEDSRLTAYGAYVQEQGGALKPKITAKEIKSMTEEEKSELVEDCYDFETLVKWSKGKDKTLASLALVQKKAIDEYDPSKEKD